MNAYEFSVAANGRFEALGSGGELVAKCFWKLFGEERLVEKLDLAWDVTSEAIVKFLELVHQHYQGDEAAWCTAIRNAMVEFLMEDHTIRTPRRRQSEGVKPVECLTNQEDDDVITEYQNKQSYASTLKLLQERQEALELIEWIANGDKVDRLIVGAILAIMFNDGYDKVNNAKIARSVGCHPQTVNARRKKMYQVYLDHSPEILHGWE